MVKKEKEVNKSFSRSLSLINFIFYIALTFLVLLYSGPKINFDPLSIIFAIPLLIGIFGSIILFLKMNKGGAITTLVINFLTLLYAGIFFLIAIFTMQPALYNQTLPKETIFFARFYLWVSIITFYLCLTLITTTFFYLNYQKSKKLQKFGWKKIMIIIFLVVLIFFMLVFGLPSFLSKSSQNGWDYYSSLRCDNCTFNLSYKNDCLDICNKNIEVIQKENYYLPENKTIYLLSTDKEIVKMVDNTTTPYCECQYKVIANKTQTPLA